MSQGCPVICSRVASLPEVAGDAARMVEPDDLAGYVKNVTDILTSPRIATELRERGLKQAARFSWRRSAEQTLKVYAETIQRIRA